MEVGSGNDNTDDSSVSPDDAVHLDLPVTSQPTNVSIFHTKIKGKAKVSGSFHDPELEAVNIAGAKPLTTLSGAGLHSDGTDQAVEDSVDLVDSDDVITDTFDLFSGNLGEDAQLYVMQHVLRGDWFPYEIKKRCEEVRLNPEQLEIEIDLRFEEDLQETPEPLKLQKQTLSSTVVSSGIQYAVGFLEKKKLHLHPVHAILQLRPSFASLDGKARTEASEPWVLLQYHPIDSSISNEIKHRMVVEGVENVEYIMRQADFLHFLHAGKLTDLTVSGSPSMRAYEHLSLGERLQRAYQHLSLGERLQRWFCKEKQVNNFAALKKLAYGYSEDDLRKVLPSYANLVQGLWVCKSSLLYRPPEAKQRDNILLRFTERKTIKYDELKEIKLNPSVFECMMGGFAYERKCLREWKFKEYTDSSFTKRYENVSQEQQKTSLASDNVKITANGDRDVFLGQSMSSQTREHLPAALRVIFYKRKVFSLQSIVQGLRELALNKSSVPRLLANAAAHAVCAPEEELCSVIDQVAVRIHDVYVLKSAEKPGLDPLRNLVINLYQGKEPNAKLWRREVRQAAQSSLMRHFFDSEYNQVMKDLCICERGRGSWVLKSSE